MKRIEAVLRRTRNKPELTNGLEVRQENFQVYYNQQAMTLTYLGLDQASRETMLDQIDFG